MKVRFLCPNCEAINSSPLPGQKLWECPTCQHRLSFDITPDPKLEQCVICGNHEFYRRKDFPQTLGMVTLVLAFTFATIAYYNYNILLMWIILLGTAVFDSLLYIWVGDAIICYRCNSEYRGFAKEAPHQTFDIGIGEKYRQEQIRKNAIKKGN